MGRFNFSSPFFLIFFIGTVLSFASAWCPPFQCAIKCPKGYAKAADGCPVCVCKGDFNPCAYKSCPKGKFCEVRTIYCITTPCPGTHAVCVCPEYDNLPECEFGWVKDKNNCTTPKCFDPCLNVVCRKGEVCRGYGVACIDFNCSARAECVPVKTPPRCPVVKSTKHCPYGPAYDSNDCPTSKCHYPCAGVKCPRGEVCEPQTVYCIRAPCPMQPRCVPDKWDSGGFWDSWE